MEVIKYSERKTCRTCGINQNRSDFYNDSKTKDGKYSQCKKCKNKYSVEYAKKRKHISDVFRLKARRASNKCRRLKNYGVTEEQYDKMLIKQGDKCCGCSTPQSEQKRSMAVDHCHKTGKVRGLLCDACNTALGLLKDSQATLEKLKRYLNDND